MSIRGITIYGANVMLTSDDESSVSSEPVYLAAEMIDAAIATGALEAGRLNNVTVSPPVEEWPPEWRILKE